MIELLRIPLPNRVGQLFEVVKIISAADVDMKALSLANQGTDDSEVLLVVTNIVAAEAALEEAGIGCKSQAAIVVEVADHTGGLAAVLEATTKADLSIQDLFTFVSRVEGKALAVATFPDPEQAKRLLTQAGVSVLEQLTDASATDAGPHLLDEYLGGSFFW